MIINADTKIAAILKKDPTALESIISISPMFAKLRNPLLRKIMAVRTSLQMAANMGGCTLQDFYDKLSGPNFETGPLTGTTTFTNQPLPVQLKDLSGQDIIHLDVRPIIDSGGDPLTLILEKIKLVKPGQALKISNSFEPAPLIALLQKKGFESSTSIVGPKLVETYFYKTTNEIFAEPAPRQSQHSDWQTVLEHFSGKLVYIDVRKLEQPLPMTSILEATENLISGTALFVYHKRIPVFLLPELEDRNLEYRIKENAGGDVHLLIYHSKDVST